MRRRTLAALATGATGLVASSLAVLTTPLTTPAAADDGLPAFRDCAELRQWYVDAALEDVGPWGLGWPGHDAGTAIPLATDARAATSEATDAAVGNGATGTNVQEAGVDEPDVAKTDGGLVVHLRRRHLVLTDVSGVEPRELSRLALPRRMADPNLLLAGDRVVVFGDDTDFWGGPMPVDGLGDVGSGRLAGPAPTDTRTRIITVDISDPTAPATVQEDSIEGHLVSAREYDGVVRAVIATGLPPIDFVQPNGRRTRREALRENRRILQETTIEDWLPQVRTRRPGSGSTTEPLHECDDVRHPEAASGFGTISVVTFAPQRPGGGPLDRETTAVTTGGELVYSSVDRLYIATATGWWDQPISRSRGGVRRPAPPTTQVHAFALDGLDTEYLASGEVPGMVRDKWSFSEYDGMLRVATALGDRAWDPDENGIVVLAEHGDELRHVGRVDGMGIGEEIRSVRWWGDLAVVVTFRQVDPLYTVDLSDPTEPRVLGELKIPGFSGYLHPLGDDLLLGLGQNATRRGLTTGAQAAVFDLRDLRRPQRLDTAAFGRDTEVGTTMDPRAFTYLPEQRIAAVPVHSYRDGRTRACLLRIGSDGSISRTSTLRVSDWPESVRTIPVAGDRLAVLAEGRVGKLIRVG